MKKYISLIFIFTLLGLLAIAGIFYFNLKQDMNQVITKKEMTEELVTVYNELINDPNASFKVPESFLDNYKDEEYLEQHINDINRFVKRFSEDSDSVDYEALFIQRQNALSQASQKIKNLEEKNDSITTTAKNRLNSLQEEKDSLKSQLAIKDNVLAQSKSTVDSLNRILTLAEKNRKDILRFKNPSGIEVTYFGQIEGDKANGFGIGIYANGTRYEGEWKNNKRHGEGSLQLDSGERYEGNFQNGHLHGYGIYYWPSAERYEGEWERSERHGQGTLYDKNGNITYKGEWIHNVPAK